MWWLDSAQRPSLAAWLSMNKTFDKLSTMLTKRRPCEIQAQSAAGSDPQQQKMWPTTFAPPSFPFSALSWFGLSRAQHSWPYLRWMKRKVVVSLHWQLVTPLDSDWAWTVSHRANGSPDFICRTTPCCSIASVLGLWDTLLSAIDLDRDVNPTICTP